MKLNLILFLRNNNLRAVYNSLLNFAGNNNLTVCLLYKLVRVSFNFFTGSNHQVVLNSHQIIFAALDSLHWKILKILYLLQKAVFGLFALSHCYWNDFRCYVQYLEHCCLDYLYFLDYFRLYWQYLCCQKH